MKTVTVCARHFLFGRLTQGGWDVRGLVALVAETRGTVGPHGCETRERPGSGCNDNTNTSVR
jgi:hypothetical protein